MSDACSSHSAAACLRTGAALADSLVSVLVGFRHSELCVAGLVWLLLHKAVLGVAGDLLSIGHLSVVVNVILRIVVL